MQAASKKARKDRRTPDVEVPADGHLSLRKAAKILGCVAQTVGTYVMQKRLVAVVVGGRTFVTADSVFALREELEQDRSAKTHTKL